MANHWQVVKKTGAIDDALVEAALRRTVAGPFCGRLRVQRAGDGWAVVDPGGRSGFPVAEVYRETASRLEVRMGSGPMWHSWARQLVAETTAQAAGARVGSDAVEERWNPDPARISTFDRYLDANWPPGGNRVLKTLWRGVHRRELPAWLKRCKP